jgi:hypothetical protein
VSQRIDFTDILDESIRGLVILVFWGYNLERLFHAFGDGKMVENGIGLGTALIPFIGCEKSTEIAYEALASGRSVYEIVLEKGNQLDDNLSPENMIQSRYFTKSARG